MRQHEVGECGTACILMIANQFATGAPAALASFRRRHPELATAVSLLDLKRVANALGLEPRVLRVRDDALKAIRGACIAHWDLDHFVVLERIVKGRALVHDPATGTSWMPLDQFFEHFSGLMMVFSANRPVPSSMLGTKDKGPVASLRELLRHVPGAKSAISCIFALGLAIELVALTMPLMTKVIVDRLTSVSGANSSAIVEVAAVFAGAVVMQACLLMYRFEALARLSATFNLKWVDRTIRRLLNLPMAFFERRRVADIASRISSIEAIQKTIATSLVSSGLDGLMAIAGVLCMSYYSSALASVVAVAFVLYIAVRASVYRRLERLSAQRVVGSSRNSVEVLETLRSIQAFKLAGLEASRATRYIEETAALQVIDYRINKVNGAVSTASFAIIASQRIAMLTIAFMLVTSHHLTLGEAMACVALAEQFVARGPSFVDKMVDLRLLSIHLDRLADVASAEPEVRNEGGHRPQLGIDVGLHVSAQNLGFKHPGSDRWLFRGLNFDVQPGSCVLLDGPSGIGKTTLLKIVLGLIEPTEGLILADGVPLKEWNTAAFRSQCATVMQDDCVLAGTIADNIAFFDQSASIEAVRAAASEANIDREVQRLPMGYSTFVSDLDGTLSGGQRQRVLLARAIYTGARLLILDEAFSHLDIANRSQIGSTIGQLGMTRIVVSHTEHSQYQPDQLITLGKEESPHYDAAVVSPLNT